MARSLSKGFFVDPRLAEKIKKLKDAGLTTSIKTWARRSTITPDMVGMAFEVHNGKQFIVVQVVEAMVGHKLGEFSPTRRFNGHSSKKDKIAKK
jgi:small subunit ribosomal protein S19